jgi:hypothetical protein
MVAHADRVGRAPVGIVTVSGQAVVDSVCEGLVAKAANGAGAVGWLPTAS